MVKKIMEIKLKFLGLLLAFSFFSFTDLAFAEVRLEVNPRSGALDETFVFAVVIDSPENSEAPKLTPSEDFGVSYIGPQSSVTIVNGDVSRRVAYNYRLIPRRIGLLKTPGADVEIGGVTVHVNPIEVTITEKAPPAPAQRISGLSLRQSAEPRDVFVGQQVDSVLELQTAINLIEPQFLDMSFDGFWVETIADNERSSRLLGNDQYDILRFRKALYPLSAGAITIPARKLKAQIRDTRRNRPSPFDSFNPFDADIFDNFFRGGPLKEILVESGSITINAKALPALPQNFPTWGLINPIVGETTIQAKLPSGTIKVGETKTLEIVVVSTGNLSPLKGVQLKLPATLKMYEDAPETKNFESGGVLMSRKIFRVSLVPLNGGKITIPPLELGYFNTAENNYSVARSQEITLEVSGSSSGQSTILSQKAEVQQTLPGATPTVQQAARPDELLAYQEESWVEKLLAQISISMLLLLMTGIGVLSLLIRFIMATRASHMPTREGLAALERATSLTELSFAFRRYVAFKLKLGESDLRGEQFRAVAERKITDKNVLFTLQSILDEFDAALYSPGPQLNVETLKKKASSVARTL